MFLYDVPKGNAVIPGSPASVINDAINVKFVPVLFCKIMFSSSIAGGIDVALHIHLNLMPLAVDKISSCITTINTTEPALPLDPVNPDDPDPETPVNPDDP
jgi:hypothetical protein